MKWALPDFDITRCDSAKIDMRSPERLAKQLLQGMIAGPEEIDVQAGMPEFDEARVRLLVNAVLASSLMPSGAKRPWAKQVDNWIEDDWNLLGGEVKAADAGIKYMKLDGALVIALPHAATAEASESIIDSLNNLCEKESRNNDWIIDFYNICSVSPSLMAFLIGLQLNQRMGTRQSFLLWLRKEALPPELMPAVRKYFYLMKKGVFLLSKIEDSDQ